MNLFSQIRSRLVVKLFLSYLFIILAMLLVLAVSAEFVIPLAFDRHMSNMMGTNGMMGMGNSGVMGNTLYDNFRSAMDEALLIAGLVAMVVAIGVSVFISRRVVSPVREMTRASRYIAEGHYDQRVAVQKVDSDKDMDELGKLAHHFNQMAEKLDQTESMRRQLIGDVSHELRTPLTTISGSMEGLIDGVLPPTPEIFQQIVRETDRLQRIVSDLQELSRVEAKAVLLDVKAQPVEPILKAVTQRLAPQFRAKGVVLKLEVQPYLPLANLDEDRFSQILINIIGNALQYTPEGGHVTVSAQKQGNFVEIRVRDDGEGIDAVHLPHLFTRFYRVDKSRSRARGGSGIGLTIAKQLVDAQGGEIWAESSGVGQGSTFGFTVPVADQA
ncbi:MAG: ATP-binding protein [Anaerolineales bacterium]